MCEKHFFNKDEARKEMDELAVLFDRLWKEPMSSKEKQLQAALKLAVDAHFGQTRKSDIEGVKIPYALHPIQVMERLRSWGIGDVDVLTAALLHDVVEDTKVTKEDLIPLFGETVAAIVGELTFTPPEGSDVDKSLAKAKYMATFATASQSALLIKVADRLCNCMDFVQAGDIKYAKKYFDKAAPLWEALQARKDTIDEFLLADIMDDYETVLASVADDEASVIARKPSDEHAG